MRVGIPCILTDIDLRVPALAASITSWAKIACENAKAKGIILQSSSELYLRPIGPNRCYYYFADHSAQVVFWADTIPIEQLDLEVWTESPNHLRESSLGTSERSKDPAQTLFVIVL